LFTGRDVLNFSKFAEQVFKSDPNISWVGVVDYEYKVLGLEVRKGGTVYSPEESIRDFFSLVAPIVVDAFGRRQHILGSLEGITAKYEKRIIFMGPLEGKVVILSFEPNVTLQFMSRARETITQAASLLD
jgi:hypothetical protein